MGRALKVIAIVMAIAAIAGLFLAWREADGSERKLEKRVAALEAQLDGALERGVRLRDVFTALKADFSKARRALRAERRANFDLLLRLDREACFTDPNRVGVRRYVAGPLFGDIDGDGGRDRVRVVGERSLARNCAYRLEAGGYSVDVDLGTWEGKQMFPRLLTELDDRDGLEIVVEIGRGASSESAQIYSVVDGRLVPVTFSDRPGEADFSFSGSMGYGGAIDCLNGAGGSIVLSEFHYQGKGYAVTRRFYDMRGASLVLLSEEHYRGPFEILNRFTEFHGTDFPFDGCRPRIEGA